MMRRHPALVVRPGKWNVRPYKNIGIIASDTTGNPLETLLQKAVVIQFGVSDVAFPAESRTIDPAIYRPENRRNALL